MVAKDTSERAEAATETDVPSPSFRRPLLTFGIGVAVLAGLLGSAVLASEFLGAAHDRLAGITIALEPVPAVTQGPSPQFSLIGPRSPGGQLAADPALVEDSPFGPLPIVAADGRSPMTAYARPFDAKDKRPRIAVVVGGLNVSASNTRLALARLPGPITLAFSPFASDAQAAVDAAREAGHEVLLEVPMEPLDFPESDPGAHTLMVAASSDENIRRLSWSLSRFTGYVGITNLLGARFMSEQSTIEPVLKETARRGLIFFDNGTSRSSLALTAARHVGGSIATGMLVLDDVQTKESVDKKLAELETEARRSGSAIGVASAFPVSIARIATWAEGAETRGFALVPISALASKSVAVSSSPAPAAQRTAPPPAAPVLRASAQPAASHAPAHH
jgi:polysaccharide deacetylase 2 family uncharacterized protein YibQ